MDDYPLLNLFWTMLMFFFFVMWVWLVISIFADNFHRKDHSGWAKAGWTFLILFLPVLGVLLYIIARPKMTEQDVEMIAEYEKSEKLRAGYSAAEEIERLHKLKEQGVISEEEYSKLKNAVVS